MYDIRVQAQEFNCNKVGWQAIGGEMIWKQNAGQECDLYGNV